MIQSAVLHEIGGNLYSIEVKRIATNQNLSDTEFIFDASKYDDIEEIDLR